MAKFAKYHIQMVEKNDKRYSIISLKEYIDFPAKRLYFIENLGSTAPTGQHSHLEEKELFVMSKGSCIAIIDQGNGKEDVPLATGDAIFVPNYVWHGFKDLSSEALITALSSTEYREDRSDYIEDYDEYLKIRDEKLKEAQ